MCAQHLSWLQHSYTCIHTYIHTYIHTHIQTHRSLTHHLFSTLHASRKHTYMHTYMHTYIHTYIHTHIHTQVIHTPFLHSTRIPQATVTTAVQKRAKAQKQQRKLNFSNSSKSERRGTRQGELCRGRNSKEQKQESKKESRS